MRSLAESVESGAGEQLRAAHHPIEMIDRHCLRFGDAVDVDVQGHAVLDALIHQTSASSPGRLSISRRMLRFELRLAPRSWTATLPSGLQAARRMRLLSECWARVGHILSARPFPAATETQMWQF